MSPFTQAFLEWHRAKFKCEPDPEAQEDLELNEAFEAGHDAGVEAERENANTKF